MKSRQRFLMILGLLTPLFAVSHTRWRPNTVLHPVTLIPRAYADGSVPDGLKSLANPCGLARAMGPENTFDPGDVVTVEWEETVNHESKFEIILIDRNDQPVRQLYMAVDTQAGMPTLANPNRNSTTITMPGLAECSGGCGLMLIQHMGPLPDGPFIPYFSCANVLLNGTLLDSGGGDRCSQ
jgi:hypothetical protein